MSHKCLDTWDGERRTESLKEANQRLAFHNRELQKEVSVLKERLREEMAKNVVEEILLEQKIEKLRKENLALRERNERFN